jgi:enamine deaminase RidA (YjgF/YER057c/UK114 family)
LLRQSEDPGTVWFSQPTEISHDKNRLAQVARFLKKELFMTITRLHSNTRMSQAVIYGDTVYLAGQVGAPGASITIQTETVLAQIEALLADAGSKKSNILSATIWLADMADFAEMNRVWDAWLGGSDAPARATGEAKLATAEYKVEIIIVAARL